MRKLGPNDLQQLKGGGGERFAQFLNRLILAEAACGGLDQSDVQTQLRANIPDGGVDAQVDRAIPQDSTGWFGVPTCWQYKAVDTRSVSEDSLREEIHKPYVENLIRKGYGYRFCVLGDVTPQGTCEDWEPLLKAEARAINPHAPDPRIVHGGHLLHWGERFPAVVAWLRSLAHAVFHWEAWRVRCRAVTRHYVPNPEWQGIWQQILQQADFRAPCVGGDPCLPIGGAAGVGKTRLVFETLNELFAAPGLVVYAADEQEAKRVATAIANTPEQIAILVADECSPQTRHFLNENLRGHVNRIRVICVDNTGERFAAPAAQVWLSADSLKNTDAILEANFPDVPGDRRHQYAELSRGFVRLAADMCHHDPELAAGDMSRLVGTVESYVRDRLSRLKADYLPWVSLLALFHKVGSREEVQSEAEALCRIADCSLQQMRDAVRHVRESPGFVVQAGRYWYVTPEIVARVLFAEGWARWVRDDPAAFLQQVPEHLQQHVVERAGRLGGREVRDQLGSFFRRWFEELTARDLADPRVSSLAAALVETTPEEYLPRLRSVLELGPAVDIMAIQGQAGLRRQRPPRRTMVWLLEGLVSFPEFFRDCEASLFRLALHEAEPQIGNNASAIWETLFSVHLSGAATPFFERIGVLKERTASADLASAKLAFRAVKRALERALGKVLGPPVVAGRLRPRDWQPNSAMEELACYRAALSLCEEHLTKGDSEHRRMAFEVLIESLPFALYHGLCDDLASILAPTRVTDVQARMLLKVVDKFLETEERTGRAGTNEQAAAYLQKVRRWSDAFRPSDFDGRLRSVCSREPWDRRFSRDPSVSDDDTDEIAAQLLVEPSRLERHLDWLADPEARAAERLGFALGRADKGFVSARVIFEHAIARGAAPLIRGYVRGLVFSQRPPSNEVCDLMTRLEAAHPAVAADVYRFGGDLFDALNRVTRLIELGILAPRYLAGFAMGIGNRELRLEEVGRLLPYFVEAADSGDGDSAKAGVRFLGTWLLSERQQTDQNCLGDEPVRSQAWRLAETTLPHVGGQAAWEWAEVVGKLAAYDTPRAAELFGEALLSEDSVVGQEAEGRLAQLAPAEPQAVMRGIGRALLDPLKAWRLQAQELRDVLAQLPSSCVVEWVRNHGLDAARSIAPHLPAPYVDESNNPVVPQVLDVILREYDDEQVLSRFLEGAHSWELFGGEATERLRREADDAKRFLNHPNRRIRDWAKHEIANRLSMAEWGDREHAEHLLPS